MSEKINISDLEQILAQRVEQRQVDREAAIRILEDARRLVRQSGATERQERPETRDVTILVTDQETVQLLDTDRLSAFTVQIESGEDHNAIIGRMVEKSRVFNANVKRASSRIRTLGEAFGSLKPKKDLEGFPKKIYTKEAALVLATPNLVVPGNAEASD